MLLTVNNGWEFDMFGIVVFIIIVGLGFTIGLFEGVKMPKVTPEIISKATTLCVNNDNLKVISFTSTKVLINVECNNGATFTSKVD